MEPTSILQPEAPILVNAPIPPPLEGTVVKLGPPDTCGGFGTIYRGMWTRGQEESVVCVKRLRNDRLPGTTQAESLQRRIRRETLVWESAKHPNIYPYLGYQVVNDEIWLISPWTESGNLYDYLENNRDIGDAEKLKLLKDATQGLAYLHSPPQPIAHGDINPSNVLIRIINKVATAALCDFGLSRIMNDFVGQTGLTTSGAVTGTIAYSAPELVLEKTLPTQMSDMYGLGGTILYTMSGKKPFHRKTVVLTIWAIAQNEEPQPADHPDLPANDPLWPLLRQCWSPEPTNRPTAQEFIERLDKLMSGK